MRRIFLRNITLWLTILSLLWSSQGYGYVWCMTEAGTHLESISNSHCAQSDPATDSSLAAFAEEDGDCGPCFDLAAGHDTLQHRNRSGCDLGSPFLLSTIVYSQWAPSALVRQLDNNLILEPLPRVATTLLVHRTIVLLI